MLAPELRYSSALHAALALLHRAFADREAGSDGLLAHHIAGVSCEPAGAGHFVLRCGVQRQAVISGSCTEQSFACRFAFREDTGGGALTLTSRDPEGMPRSATFSASRSEHRVRAFAHRWLWIWENLADAAAFDELLQDDGLDVHFHSGEAISTRGAFRAAARRMDAGPGATHHVLDSLRLDATGSRYAVSAEVSWHGQSAGGTPLRARTREAWDLVDGGDRFPRLKRLRVEVIEPLHAEVPEEAPGPFAPNAPSDDAEAGGP